jgi:NAD(P)H-flavin reductase
MAYYPLQVEKFCHRYEYLVSKLGKEIVEESWTEEERQIAGEFLSHAYALRAEKDQAKQEQRLPEISTLLQKWGGVTIAYRKDITAAPSYTLNHEEVEKALEEGIRIFDHATPVEVRVDQYGHACGLVLKKQGEQVMLPARSILVAAGTKPNTNLRHDDPDNVFLDGAVFQALSEEGLTPVIPERLAKPDQAHVLMSVRQDGKAMSFFGDLHPSFAGNVVKAMASAKQGYPVVSRALEKVSSSSLKGQDLLREVNHQLRATIHAVNRLTPTILEIVIHAPLATRTFKPGQFYRLQNFESLSPVVQGTRLAMEGLALTGASVDPEKGLLSTIVLEMGGSSSLCQFLKPGDPVILMGPTGEPTEIHPNETVLLVGGGLGNAVLFSIGQAFRRLGSKVLYVAGYKKQEDRYKIEEIEAASDQIIWCCDEAPGFIPSRPQDHSFVGNIVDAMRAYGEGKLDNSISLKTVDRMIVIGSDRMMAAVAFARHNQLKEFLNPHHIAIGSINSPMQCMMKEICAQCLQRHVDPKTGEEIIVYSCTNQDQSLDAVDFNNLSERLRQNSVQEKITKLWLKELKVA